MQVFAFNRKDGLRFSEGRWTFTSHRQVSEDEVIVIGIVIVVVIIVYDETILVSLCRGG